MRNVQYTTYAAMNALKSMEDNLIDLSWEDTVYVFLNRDETLHYVRNIDSWKNQFISNKHGDGTEGKFKCFIFSEGVHPVVVIFGDEVK